MLFRLEEDEGVLAMAQAHAQDSTTVLEHFGDCFMAHALEIQVADQNGANEILLLDSCLFGLS